jgi:hypothetical protein
MVKLLFFLSPQPSSGRGPGGEKYAIMPHTHVLLPAFYNSMTDVAA